MCLLLCLRARGTTDDLGRLVDHLETLGCVRPHERAIWTFLVVGAVAMLVLTTLSFVLAPVDAAPRESGSKSQPGPDGAKAAYLVLEGLGHDIDRSYEPIATLQADPSKTMVMLGNPRRNASGQDVRAAALR